MMNTVMLFIALLVAVEAQEVKVGTYWPSFENLTATNFIWAATTEEDFGYENLDVPFTQESFVDYLDGTSFGLELWWIVFGRLGISFKMKTPQGSRNSLSALTQMVVNGDAQVSVIPTVFVPEETKGLVITQPTHSTRYKLFVQSPTSVSTSLSLGKVFTPVLWVAIIVSMLMMGVILIFIEFVGQKARIRSYLATPADIGQLIIIIIGCFCYQGAIQIASGCSGRVLVWTSLVCGYLIYVSYNTLVISQLTTVSFKPPFDSLQDMAAKGTHRLIVRNQTALLDDIKITRIKDGKRGILADVWDQLLPMKPKAENLYNERSSVARLCKEKIAMLDSELEINAATQQRYKCNAISLKDSYFRSNLGFVLSKNNSFNAPIIRLFNRMRETGIINRMRRALDQPDVGPLQPLPTLNPIELDTLIPMLVVLYMGMFMSLVTLGLEIAFARGGDQLKKNLRERGFKSRMDFLCFWRTIKRHRELREMENAMSEEETEEEDESDGGQQKKSRRRRKLKSILTLTRNFQRRPKVQNKNQKIKKVKPEYSPTDSLQKEIKKLKIIYGIPPAYNKVPAKAPAKPRVLRRQDRVTDLTTLLPKPVVASLTPVYLAKNILHDHDHGSARGSIKTVTPDSVIRTPKVTPVHSDRSEKLDIRNNRNLVTPGRSEDRIGPGYDPQGLLRPKPSPREPAAPPLPPREGQPTPMGQKYVNVAPPPDKPQRRPAQRRSSPLAPTPPSKERQHEWAPLYYYEEQQRPRRSRPHEQSPDRDRARPPPLYRDLLLSLDSDGFMNGRSVLDRNPPRKTQDSRRPNN